MERRIPVTSRRQFERCKPFLTSRSHSERRAQTEFRFGFEPA